MSDLEPRSSGIYGLFRLDGGPIAAHDALALGIEASDNGANWLIAGHDSHAPDAVHLLRDAEGDTLLVGEIAGLAETAARLGLRSGTPVARVARAALARFAGDTPAELLGEWSLLHRAADGHLTLMVGPARRDRLHYAVVGTQVAVAPDLFRLARIGWIGSEPDLAGLLYPLGRMPIRSSAGDSTMLARVRQLGAGASVAIDTSGRISPARANALVQPPPWRGSYADALAESEALLRQIMRERLARTAQPALLLSGGLDSSLLAWLAAEERGSKPPVLTLTSAAPPGSGLADEHGFAALVAEHLGLACEPVAPAPSADFFRPPDAILAGASGPLLSNRHCLTEAFQIAAKARGATMLVNGTFGEMTVTARLPSDNLARRLRGLAALTYHRLRGSGSGEAGMKPFHVRLAPHLLAHLPDPIRAAMDRPSAPEPGMPSQSGPLGFLPGADKSLAQPNEFYPGALRMDFPFRDVRLYRLFAGFPLGMLLTGGDDRPVVRTMLDGRLPDTIRLRRHGMPAEPDRFIRMQRQALAARARIPEFRKVELGDWLDLDWLDQALLRIAASGAASNDETNEVQLTAMTAEFLYWWRSRS